MSIAQLQAFVSSNLYKANGSVAPMKPDKWWFKNNASHYRDEILQLTDFLVAAPWPQRIWHIQNNVLVPNKCTNPACSASAKWSMITSRYAQYCSKECSANAPGKLQKFKTTCIERFGVAAPAQSAEVLQKRREIALEKYGVDHPGKTAAVKETIKRAFIEKYGVDNPSKDPAVRAKVKATNQARFGVDYPLQNSTVLEKRTATNIERFGVVSPTQVPEIHEKQRATLYAKYGIGANMRLLDGQEHNDVRPRTRYNQEFEQFLIDNSIAFETSNRTILAPKELDCYLPEYKLAIELCGVYFHGENFERGKDYHRNKWMRCREQGITLLTYFDDEFDKSLSIIKSKILYMTGRGKFTRIGARQLSIRPVTISEEREFLERNHLQGFLNNRNFSVGAYQDNKLLAVLCVTNRKAYREITRFAVDIDYSIPCVFSKMLAHYVNTTGYSGDIISFSDNCHSNGNLYSAAGFEAIEHLGASYYYSRGGAPRENRQAFMKSKIEKKFGVDINGKTEEAIMRELRYNKVWDCGKIKWKLIV